MLSSLGRTTLVTLLCLASTPVPARTATLTLTNFDGVNSNPLLNASGRIATRGSVYAGSFSLSDGALTHAWKNGLTAQIAEDFRQFGDAIAIGFNRVPGMYQDSVLAEIPAEDFLNGAAIYTVITNEPLSAMPMEWLIYKHPHHFRPGDEPLEPALLNESTEGTLLVGVFGERRVTLGELVDRPAYELAETIPEPAPTILLGLGGFLAFCGRSRNRRKEPGRPPAGSGPND